eukprot:5272654-Prymnesium_polylepis.1
MGMGTAWAGVHVAGEGACGESATVSVMGGLPGRQAPSAKATAAAAATAAAKAAAAMAAASAAAPESVLPPLRVLSGCMRDLDAVTASLQARLSHCEATREGAAGDTRCDEDAAGDICLPRVRGAANSS